MGMESVGGLVDDVAMAYQNAKGEEGKPLLPESFPGKAFSAWKIGMSVQGYNAFLSMSNWKNFSEGKGLKWGGVLGLRKFAQGKNAINRGAFTSGLRKVFVPGNPITTWFKHTNATQASKYIAGGMFGKGGVYEHPLLARVLGGGIFGEQKIAGKINRYYSIKEMREAGKIGPELANIRKSNRAAISAIRSGKGGILREAAGKKLLGTAARGVTFASWAILGVKLGAMAAEAAAGAFGNTVDTIEQKLSAFMPHRGINSKLSPGFMTSMAATERQRALQAMGNRPGSVGLFGNEANMQHTGSTW